MAIKTRTTDTSNSADSRLALRDFPPPYDPGCCQSDDRHRSLILTQLDGTTDGFPLSWLYRWQWRQQATDEVLTLTLTDHEVTLHGVHLDRILEHLRNHHGLNLCIKDERYYSIYGDTALRISSITIKPVTRSTHHELN